MYYSLAIISLIVGLISLFTFSTLFGIILLGFSIPLFNRVSKIKNREKYFNSRILHISDSYIKIEEDDNLIELSRYDIEDLEPV